jgi:hypothetical protein
LIGGSTIVGSHAPIYPWRHHQERAVLLVSAYHNANHAHLPIDNDVIAWLQPFQDSPDVDNLGSDWFFNSGFCFTLTSRDG